MVRLTRKLALERPATDHAAMGEPRIYIESDGVLRSCEDTPFKDEDELQGLLAEHVELMSGDRDPLQWLLVTREAGVPDCAAVPDRWSLDHLFVSGDRVPTLVEVKRASDTRIRREVVGQLLDYAANGARWWTARSLGEFARASLGESYAERMRVLLGSGLGDDFQQAEEAFWAEVEHNLRSGKMRLVFAADRLPAELVTVIEFLNRAMMPNIEVIGLQVERYVVDDKKVIVTRTKGESELDRQAGRTPLPVNVAVRAFLERTREIVNEKLGPKAGSYVISKAVRKQLSYWVRNGAGAAVWYVVHPGGYDPNLWSPIDVGLMVESKTTENRLRIAQVVEGLLPQLPPNTKLSSAGKTVKAITSFEWEHDEQLDDALATKIADALTRFESVLSPHLNPVDA